MPRQLVFDPIYSSYLKGKLFCCYRIGNVLDNFCGDVEIIYFVVFSVETSYFTLRTRNVFFSGRMNDSTTKNPKLHHGSCWDPRKNGAFAGPCEFALVL